MSLIGVQRSIEKAYLPGYGADTNTVVATTVDEQGCLRTRSAIMTDEGGYTTNYSTSALNICNAATFTSGSNIVTGTGFSDQEVYIGDYVRAIGDSVSLFNRIESITDTILTLEYPYGGATATTTAVTTVELMRPGQATIAYTSGAAIFTLTSAVNDIVELERDLDIIPVVIEKEIIISQRIANQTIYIGLYDDTHTNPFYWAWFKLDGTNTSLVTTESAYNRGAVPNAWDIESNIVSIPVTSTTVVANRYKVEANADVVRFLINDIVVATHRRVVIKANASLTSIIRCVNGASSPTAGTIITVNWSRAYNFNKISVGFSDKDLNLFSSNIPKELDSCIPVRVAPQNTWRASFARTLSNPGVDSAYFNIIKAHAAHTITQTGGNLSIVNGTSANAESIIRSNRYWSDSWILSYSLATTAARAANQQMFIEMVDIIGDNLACTINSATSVTITIPNNPFDSTNIGQSMYIGNISNLAAIPNRYAIASVSGNTITFTVAGWPASGSCTVSLFGWNYHHIFYDGATATANKVDAQRMGWNSGDTTLTINTTTSAASPPTHLMQLMNDDASVYYSDGLIASNAAYQMTSRGSRRVLIPDSNTPLYLQIRCMNGSTAPVTNTWLIGHMVVEEFAPVPVVLQNTKQVGAHGASVSINNTVAVSGTVTANIGTGSIAAGTNAIGDVGFQYRANATGAASIKHVESASGTNITNVKSSAGRLIGWNICNTTSAMKYIKVYNTSAVGQVTVGTTAPAQTIAVPTSATGAYNFSVFEGGIGYSAGITIATTSNASSADTSAVAANDLIIDMFYL